LLKYCHSNMRAVESWMIGEIQRELAVMLGMYQ